jgi:hypothetical protein
VVAKIPSARQIAMRRITSEPRREGIAPRKTELHYYIITGPAGRRRLAAKRVARILRGHWCVENRLHHVLDRTMREDGQKTRVAEGPLVLSLLRKIALAILEPFHRKTHRTRPEAQTHLAARPRKAIRLLKRAG